MPLCVTRNSSPSTTALDSLRSISWLPEPTYYAPNPARKHHGRRRSAKHISRPRNAFILFRCDFVRQGKVPRDVEKDHKNLSRIAGGVWRRMSEREKEPWVRMAKEEREMHKVMWPGYQYHKGTLGRKVRSESGSGSGIQSATGTDWNGTSSSVPYQLDDFVDFLPFATGPVRHSSCPPGKPKYIDPDWDSTLLQSSLVPRTLLITGDDLARRPSRVLMYASDPTFLSTPNAEGEEIVTSPPSHGMPTTFSWHHVSQTTQHLIDMQEMGRKVLDVRPTPVTGAYLCMAQCYPGLYEYEQATQGSFAGVDQYRYDLWNDDDFSNPRFRGPSSLLASLDPKSFDISCFTSLCPTQLGRDLASSPASSITSIAPTAASDWVIPEYKLP